MNSNKEYLNNLKKIKKQQNQLQTKILSLYYFLLAIGIALYTYEYAMMMPNPWGIVTYALTFSWIALAWFYIRPKKIKSDKKKLDELISHYDSIDAQFEVE